MIHLSPPSFFLPLSRYVLCLAKSIWITIRLFIWSQLVVALGSNELSFPLRNFPPYAHLCVCISFICWGWFRGIISSWLQPQLSSIIFLSYSQYSSLDSMLNITISPTSLIYRLVCLPSLALSSCMTGKATTNFEFKFLINFPQHEQYKGWEFFIPTKMLKLLSLQ